ncbi:PREDICTED: uncharacterized protein LOC106298169 [Brassica oleracea var. oleracea]|uniref:uncharacterized protein LOC106298169 n=1 Tax=Brassica oleracea var. oleracea TaxID=109376 RepID=UPI0006A705EA|nr:PREDICTED: uncharacterized protein LOC106298169 [Brassica oleracea var. oleracea]
MGDFNAICHNGEKLGGPMRCASIFEPFNDMLRDCKVKELPSKGDPFTWAGKRATKWIQCKLDRSFVNKEWSKVFSEADQVFLEKRGSDHRPVLVCLQKKEKMFKASFTFDKRWLELPNVRNTVKLAWNKAHGGFPASVSQRIRNCRHDLSGWRRSFQTNSKEKILILQEELEVEESARNPNGGKIRALKIELMKANREEEAYWSQKSYNKWLKKGDRNTRFFHDSVKASRNRKQIDLLVDVNGRERREEKEKGRVAMDYFFNLFSSSNPPDFQSIFTDFVAKVSPEMNVDLIKEASDEEIEQAVFSIKAASAPGPDGMTGLFFQRFWKDIGSQVSDEVKTFFISGSFPVEWNFTHLCLLPKVMEAINMSDFRPISLCSVLYKIISKILVMRLQPLLQELVSPFQSAFVPERQISDNILIAHELVHSLRTFKPVAAQFKAVKSDMSKAYDRVEWDYIRCLLGALGFHPQWIKMVMFCISSVSYAVLINDQPYGVIKPSRGLRQGDPLSPSLFVLCTEGLSHLLFKAEEAGLLHGIQFTEDGPSFSHLLFADDSLFLCKATEKEAECLQNVLEVYGRATGQVINLDKSSITFGDDILCHVKASVQTILGIYNIGGAGSYLGLPECFSGSKADLLNYIYERLHGRLSGWFARSLSLGGKEVLLKAIAIALPVFAMSCFKLPKSTIEKLTSAMRDFWWNSLEHKRKIHWLSWNKLCLPRQEGGLGFKDIECFNQALLAKQAWKVFQNPQSLLARTLKSRYFKGNNFMDVSLGDRPSFGWRSFLFGRELLLKGVRKEVGDGQSLRVWMDPWIDNSRRRAPWMKNSLVDLELKVSDLLSDDGRSWNLSILEDLFFQVDIDLILKIKPMPEEEDFWCLQHNKSGDYTVRSGYWLASHEKLKAVFVDANSQPSINGLKDRTWNIQAPQKIKLFIWRVLSGAVPVAENLISRGMKIDERCWNCGNDMESANHVLFTCPLARLIWALSDFPSPRGGFSDDSIFVNIHYLLRMSLNIRILSQIRRSFPWILWMLWKNRNKLIFEGKEFDAMGTIRKIKDDVAVWFAVQSMDQGIESGEKEKGIMVRKTKWRKPSEGWLKCNVGVMWSKKNRVMGCAWVLRDHRGVVLLHSRRSFVASHEKEEAILVGLMWAIKSLQDHQVRKVIIAAEANHILNALERPKAWPSFKFQSGMLRKEVRNFGEWKVCVETKDSNRGTFLIAQSATKRQFAQSYVAAGCPSWLLEVFEHDKS